MSGLTDWSIVGSAGESILGTTHDPAADGRAVVLIAHGFKGYKDYGMFPHLATTLAASGVIAHRFNFSHSGMTADIETFERPDLFALDTWNRQVEDLGILVEAINTGHIAGGGLPLIMFGHSRGGVSTLLTVGRHGSDAAFGRLKAVVTAAAPSTTNSLTGEYAEVLERDGFIVSPSSRTGQDLRIDRAWLDEQRADPSGHDLLSLCANITPPVTIVHGSGDATVPVSNAGDLAAAIGPHASVTIIDDANHVFDTPNPFPADATPSPALAVLEDAIVATSY